jgi:hypothetical protein
MFGAAILHVCISTAKSCAGSGDSWLSSAVPAVVGAIVGGTVAFVSAWTLRQGDREWQRERDRIAVELEVVKPLDDALVEVQKHISLGRAQADGPDWAKAHDTWQEGWVRFTPHLESEALEERYQAVGTILLDLMMDDDDIPRGPAVMVAHRAIANGRFAIAYWRRGDELPPASFPSPERTIELLGQGGTTPYAPGSPLRVWLETHEQPPWRRASEPKRSWFRLGRRRLTEDPAGAEPGD